MHLFGMCKKRYDYCHCAMTDCNKKGKTLAPMCSNLRVITEESNRSSAGCSVPSHGLAPQTQGPSGSPSKASGHGGASSFTKNCHRKGILYPHLHSQGINLQLEACKKLYNPWFKRNPYFTTHKILCMVMTEGAGDISPKANKDSIHKTNPLSSPWAKYMKRTA